MAINDDLPLSEELESLRTEHRRLDDQIARLVESGQADQLEIARLKKRKLHLKDRIKAIADITTPDISA